MMKHRLIFHQNKKTENCSRVFTRNLNNHITWRDVDFKKSLNASENHLYIIGYFYYVQSNIFWLEK